MASNANDIGVLYTPVRITNPEDFVGGVAGSVAVSSLPASATATLSNVSASASSVTVLASNAGRLGATIVNDSTSAGYFKFGSAASTASYTYYLPGTNASGVPSTLEVPARYTGIITGIWVSAAGSARVTEMTA